MTSACVISDRKQRPNPWGIGLLAEVCSACHHGLVSRPCLRLAFFRSGEGGLGRICCGLRWPPRSQHTITLMRPRNRLGGCRTGPTGRGCRGPAALPRSSAPSMRLQPRGASATGDLRGAPTVACQVSGRPVLRACQGGGSPGRALASSSRPLPPSAPGDLPACAGLPRCRCPRRTYVARVGATSKRHASPKRFRETLGDITPHAHPWEALATGFVNGTTNGIERSGSLRHPLPLTASCRVSASEADVAGAAADGHVSTRCAWRRVPGDRPPPSAYGAERRPLAAGPTL